MTDSRGEPPTESDDRIPVTVVSGVLGAGKTTLVNNLLRNEQGYRIAVIVNDMGEVNVDANLFERENEDAGIVDLSNGCICCRLQDDLLTEAERLAELREFDYLVVESSGISEPIPVARTLVEGTADSNDPRERFRLDTTVTVLDSYGFWKEFDSGASIPDSDDPDRPLAEVLVESIEFCDVLLCNKTDMVPDAEMDTIEAAIRQLQPRAHIERTTYSEVDPGLVLGTGRFDFEEARRSAGWKAQLREHRRGDYDVDANEHATGGHSHTEGAADAHGIDSFVYARDRPFDPEALVEALGERDDNVIRAKGLCHVAGTDSVIGMSRAGGAIQAGPIGDWGEESPRTELVFIGSDMDRDGVTELLDSCLTEPDAAVADPVSVFPVRIDP
ncbi:CobW family GTP-binding protein [Halalkalirubrum salinum]|uniref:CobW family GTP-binding protein n=1 Tax=Halalkalirubrum salinum TaxID=2563889 RepID=UPI0010FB0BB8|nr:GTP-binding protein [Halalkalirubrum salinum]